MSTPDEVIWQTNLGPPKIAYLGEPINCGCFKGYSKKNLYIL